MLVLQNAVERLRWEPRLNLVRQIGEYFPRYATPGTIANSAGSIRSSVCRLYVQSHTGGFRKPTLAELVFPSLVAQPETINPTTDGMARCVRASGTCVNGAGVVHSHCH